MELIGHWGNGWAFPLMMISARGTHGALGNSLTGTLNKVRNGEDAPTGTVKMFVGTIQRNCHDGRIFPVR